MRDSEVSDSSVTGHQQPASHTGVASPHHRFVSNRAPLMIETVPDTHTLLGVPATPH
jgi:hypothetical protein